MGRKSEEVGSRQKQAIGRKKIGKSRKSEEEKNLGN